jgi:hypothetical protein
MSAAYGGRISVADRDGDVAEGDDTFQARLANVITPDDENNASVDVDRLEDFSECNNAASFALRSLIHLRTHVLSCMLACSHARVSCNA